MHGVIPHVTVGRGHLSSLLLAMILTFKLDVQRLSLLLFILPPARKLLTCSAPQALHIAYVGAVGWSGLWVMHGGNNISFTTGLLCSLPLRAEVLLGLAGRSVPPFWPVEDV